MKARTIFGATVIGVAIAAMSLGAQETTGAITSFTFQERLSAVEIDRDGEPLFEEFPRPDAQYGVDIYEVVFVTRDADGSPIEALASLYLPVADERLDAPVLAFGSGTTGIGNQCAPSLEVPEEIRWGWYRQNMQAYAGQGIIAIFPDYVGFNNPDIPQRYFSKAAEGHLMLDALRAVRVAFDEYAEEIDTAVRPGAINVTSGYSQGGHAALAALDMNERYAPDVPVAGAIGFGSTNSVEMLMKEAGYYSPYIIYTYQQIYGSDLVDPSELLQERWVETLEEDVMRMCVNEFQYYYPYDREPLYTEAFYDALYSDTLSREFPTFKRILDENESGLDNHGKPVLMIQGNQDIIVTNPAQRAYVERLRASGSTVDLVEMEGVRHRHTRPAGFARSVEFIFSR
ncbi:MAG TPA: lipase family protein [Alkalispirochaeta sp.]|nr:lipase family protein [Alkalispirochaeta sp.]